MTSSLVAEARFRLPHMVGLRRRLHRHPEVGLILPQTQEVILEELARIGLDASTHEKTSGVSAVIEGGPPDGPVTLLRADCDALPLMENTGLEFASETGSTMHACGHDLHTAMLLGAAEMLYERRRELPGPVVLMFQPGEEGHHGARFMIEEGVLEAAGRLPSSIMKRAP